MTPIVRRAVWTVVSTARVGLTGKIKDVAFDGDALEKVLGLYTDHASRKATIDAAQMELIGSIESHAFHDALACAALIRRLNEMDGLRSQH